MDPIKTGQYIRAQRKKLNLSQASLAEMLYVEPQTISKWERGLGMPDYDNIDRLKEIFGCTLTDILEPIEEISPIVTEETSTTETSLIIINKQKEQTEKVYEGFKFFDFLNGKKIKSALNKTFGIEYANTYNKNFLFKKVFKKRSKEDLEVSLTQGMFKEKTNHPVLGLQAPWVYMRTFFFILLCTAIAFLGAALYVPGPFIMVAPLLSTIPLLTFLFESNFARNFSIIEVLKTFMLGGLCSIILALLFAPESNNSVVSTIFIAPIFEEIFKALLVIYFVSKIKPKNLLTGLLIGFSVGAGFTFFENILYGTTYLLAGDLESACAITIVRTITDFFSGHHYWTAFFGAIYVFFKQKDKFELKDVFNWKVLLVLLFSISLHMLWNFSYSLESAFLSFAILSLVCVLSISTLILLINVGIAQMKVKGICEEYFSERI